MCDMRDHERDDVAGCGKRPSVGSIFVGKFLDRPFRKVLDDLLQNGVYSLTRCLGFCFHGTRIVYEEGRPRQRFFLSCGSRRQSISRQIGKSEIRTLDWKHNRIRLKVKRRRVLLVETKRIGIHYGMVVIFID